MFEKVLDMIVPGKKTYILGVCFILFGAIGMAIGKVDSNEGMRLIGEGIALWTVRKAISG
jgi:hypothetical protein